MSPNLQPRGPGRGRGGPGTFPKRGHIHRLPAKLPGPLGGQGGAERGVRTWHHGLRGAPDGSGAGREGGQRAEPA